MSDLAKARLVYQERVAHRQALERLRRVYAKLSQPERLDPNKTKANSLSQPYQEEQK